MESATDNADHTMAAAPRRNAPCAGAEIEHDPDPLADLIEQWEDRYWQGEDLAAALCTHAVPDLRADFEKRIARRKKLYALFGMGEVVVEEPSDHSLLPSFPGHETLGEIGRGGMGVVYKVRDCRLGRVVAIKTIAEARYATELERERFRREAQAIARLRHTNIIPIHAIGEHEGRPYFSLEYADGGSLARRLALAPSAPVESAALVETLARALATAHEAGIIHRDLKPSNVLLTADGIPKVSDFGLAKLVDDDGEGTLSGQVLGTPSFMAPELAESGSKRVGPGADIYALGAILYQMLTGRPPFLGGSALETLRLVVSTDVVPPRRLRPDVPRDLETVCLKCLERNPAGRYSSASALASDLKRFQEGLPIAARPASLPERGARWCRRNPTVAFLGAIAVGLLMATIIILAASNARIRVETHAKEAALKKAGENEARAQAQAQESSDQRKRAEAGFAQARSAVDEFLNRVTDDALLKAPGLQTVRVDLLRSALSFYRDFLNQHTGDPGLRTALADVFLKVGRIQKELANDDESLQSTVKARDIYQELLVRQPENRDAKAGLAACHAHLGSFTEAMAIYEELIEADPANERYRRELASACFSLSRTVKDGDRQIELLRKALALSQELARQFPRDPQLADNLGMSLTNLGVCLQRRHLHQAALAVYERAVESLERAYANAPQIAAYGDHIGLSYRGVARALRELGRRDEAITGFQRAISHWQRLIHDHPAVPLFRARLREGLYDLTDVARVLGRQNEAAAAARGAAAVLDHLPKKSADDLYFLARVRARAADPSGTDASTAAADCRQLADAAMDALAKALEAGLADTKSVATDPDLAPLGQRADFQNLVARLKRSEKARELLVAVAAPAPTLQAAEKAMQIRQELLRQDPASRRYRADLASTQCAIGPLLAELGRDAEAQRAVAEALASAEALHSEFPESLRYRLDVGLAHIASGAVHWQAVRLGLADAEWLTGLSLMETALQDEPEDNPARNDLDQARIDVANKLFQLGLWEEAGELFDRVFRRNPSSLGIFGGHYWHLHAMLRKFTGDDRGYHESRAVFVKEFRTFEYRFNVFRACWCGSGPTALFEPLVPQAEAERSRYHNEDWYVLNSAMVSFRAGHPDKALEIAKEGRAAFFDCPFASAMMALIHYQLGHQTEALAALAKSDRFVEDEFKACLEGSLKPVVREWLETVLIHELVRREVHALVDGRPSQDVPFRHLTRARVLARMGRSRDAELAFAAALRLSNDGLELNKLTASIRAELSSR